MVKTAMVIKAGRKSIIQEQPVNFAGQLRRTGCGIGDGIGFFGKAIVIEEKQKLQEELNRSKRREAIGLLAGGVAHDLNNMLSGIINYPELMLMKLDKDHELVRPLMPFMTLKRITYC